jgi:hypothetical protein
LKRSAVVVQACGKVVPPSAFVMVLAASKITSFPAGARGVALLTAGSAYFFRVARDGAAVIHGVHGSLRFST